jgi:hypothetical protein
MKMKATNLQSRDKVIKDTILRVKKNRSDNFSSSRLGKGAFSE